MAAALASCVADASAAGIDLTDYHSEASAADLADLRVALGYEEWNVFGLSYGGRLTLATMRSHPEGIRAVVLDSVDDVTSGGLANRVTGIERAFTRLAEGCATAPTCAATYGDLAATIELTRQRYNASPVMVDADLGDGSGPRAFVITGDDMMAGLFNALYDAELIPLLPGLVTDLAGGDTSVIPALLDRGVRFATGYADTMAMAVNCADDAGLGTQAADAATFEDPGRLGLVVAQTGLCPPDWPATPGTFNAPVTSDDPGGRVRRLVRPDHARRRHPRRRRAAGRRDVRARRAWRPRRRPTRRLHPIDRPDLPRRPDATAGHLVRGRDPTRLRLTQATSH